MLQRSVTLMRRLSWMRPKVSISGGGHAVTSGQHALDRQARAAHPSVRADSTRGSRSRRQSRSFSSVFRFMYGHSLQLQFSFCTK
jgi:hypothetical protein